jgi:hypothetical protein
MKNILNRLFDKIYVINLEKDTERMKRINKIFNYYGIKYERFNAIYGKNEINDINELFKKKWNKFEKSLNKNWKFKNYGEYGCLMSHKKIIENALKRKFKRILIFEDDIIPIKNLLKYIKNKNKILKKKWKIIYLGSNQSNWGNIKVKGNKYRALNTYGGFALGIDKSIFKQYLKLIKYPKFPIDLYLRHFQKKYYCPVIFPQIFIAKLDTSNLREPRNIYSFSKNRKWRLRLYDMHLF